MHGSVGWAVEGMPSVHHLLIPQNLSDHLRRPRRGGFHRRWREGSQSCLNRQGGRIRTDIGRPPSLKRTELSQFEVLESRGLRHALCSRVGKARPLSKANFSIELVAHRRG
jgi:hypothetical protein